MSASSVPGTETYNSTTLRDLAGGAGDRILDKIKENPMNIIPINMICAALDIKDPFEVIAHFEPDKEDVGIMVNACIGVIPVVGPILQGVFSLFWKRAAESNVVTKEKLKEELDKLRKEMLAAVAGKIKDSEVKQWTEVCEAFLKGLKKSCKVLGTHINALKHQFAEKQCADEQVQEAVRIDLALISDKAFSLHEFCDSEEYIKFTIGYYIQSLQIYTAVLTLQEAFWYQLGIKPIFVIGKPATDKIDAVPSFAQTMHEEIMPALKNIARGLSRNVRDGAQAKGVDLKTLNLLLKSDRYLYPIPLIEAPVKMPNVAKCLREVEGPQCPECKVPEHTGPFIFRIDCINFRPETSAEDIRGYRNMSYVEEPITGCKGTMSGISAALTVILPKKRTVQIRFVGEYDSGFTNLPISWTTNREAEIMSMMPFEHYRRNEKPIPAIKEEMGIAQVPGLMLMMNPETFKSGMTYTEKMKDIERITFITDPFDDSKRYAKILFIELIIQD
ncbi:hypothetical protein PPL_01653 [Heterostelium album PN500]|uniref:Pesticidal crystal protein N-terminal domain-containing protein n=1 Tax=Heterostelium pallidum (strain ATCC 26659 / Pp 5 / PN500) TaxID=670386 RepID=D3B039_HETP5|nr:hypothetical protein PPL_01653 [Heterostelium album PN500]EFA84663.1 hypothetical protein PPL_01653 [Heterostelium album PN500]|eukprot:XP_020436776.1 hypothetical protein PPL_01653 [Heterostelium album PN500]